MPKLADLQQSFQAFLLDGQEGIEAHIVDHEKASAEKRLKVYSEAYYLRLLEALGDNYPALRTFLGEADFTVLGRAYIRAYPSRHASIRWFGEHLVQFLELSSPSPKRPELAELAKFEWALSSAFDAEDIQPMTLDAIAALPPTAWPSMRLVFHPSMQRLNLQHHVPAIRKAVDEGKPPPPAETNPRPVEWLVWRKELACYFRSLEADEAWALDAATEGATFGAICEGLCEWVQADQVALHAAGLLKRWVLDDLVAELPYSD